MKITSVQAAVTEALNPAGRAWFARAHRRLNTDRSALARLFPAVSRRCGGDHLRTDNPELFGWTVDDAVRVLLLADATIDEVTAAYNYGDADEKRAVLRALPLLDLGDAAVPLVLDALNTVDKQLIIPAVGRYAADHLPADAWRQAIVKCAVLNIPLMWVADLEQRTDNELIRMVRAFAEQRIAAKRPIPPDVLRILNNRGAKQALCPTPVIPAAERLPPGPRPTIRKSWQACPRRSGLYRSGA